MWCISWKATYLSAENKLTVSRRSVKEGCRLQRHRNGSARGTQPGQSDLDESANRGFGRQTAGCREGVEAVACELVGRDITPDVTGLCGLCQQISDQLD